MEAQTVFVKASGISLLQRQLFYFTQYKFSANSSGCTIFFSCLHYAE